MPSRLQRSLAFATASMSEFRHRVPKPATVSYSGPGPRSMRNGPPVTSTSRLQRTPQAKQPRARGSSFSAYANGPRSSNRSHSPCRQLPMGMSPITAPTSHWHAVPNAFIDLDDDALAVDLIEFGPQGGQPVGVCRRRAALAAHVDRLELFGPPHRAQARATGDVTLVVDEAGEADQVLAGRADAEHVARAAGRTVGGAGPERRGGAMRRHQGVLGCEGVESPIGGGVAQFHPAVVDGQVGGAGGGSRDHESVIAGGLQLRTEEAAHVGLAPDPGERGACSHRPAGNCVHGRAGERPGHQHAGVVGMECVGHVTRSYCRGATLGEQFIQKEARAESRPAEMPARERRVQGRGMGLARGEVHVQDGAGVSAWSVHAHATSNSRCSRRSHCRSGTRDRSRTWV